jgi:hypothetical protein
MADWLGEHHRPRRIEGAHPGCVFSVGNEETPTAAGAGAVRVPDIRWADRKES